METTPRGLRNNNPLNIEKTNAKPWRGEIRPSQDPRFAQFESIEHGYRAAFKLLNNYQKLHGCTVLSDFINRWAPPAENNTSAYLKEVCRRARLEDVSTIDTRDEYTMRKIVAAMHYVENGVEADPEAVRRGWILFQQS